MKIFVNGVAISDYLVNDITFNYDAVASSFALTLPYFEYWPISRNLFKPLKFQTVEIFDDSGKHKLLTGKIINNSKKADPNGVNLAISGYSLAGVLEDCPNTPDISTTSKGLSLKEHTENLIKPFGLKLIIDSIVESKCNETYDLTTTKESTSISAHLAQLATLKNIVLTSNKEGNLVYTQIDPTAKPIVNFSLKDDTVVSIDLNCPGQSMHSSIKLNGAIGIYENGAVNTEKSGESQTIENPLIAEYRPTIISQGTENNAIKNTAKAALANELKNINLTIELRGWKVVDEDLLLPGDIISIISPQVGLYETSNWLIRTVTLKQDPKQRTSTLICVLPESMNGETPKIRFL